MNTKWGGLWEQKRKGMFAGKVIAKKDIPAHTRIILMKNRFYEKDSDKPRFIYCFADSEGYKSKCVHVEIEESERLFTEDDVYRIIHGIENEYGLPYGEILIGDYL